MLCTKLFVVFEILSYMKLLVIVNRNRLIKITLRLWNCDNPDGFCATTQTTTKKVFLFFLWAILQMSKNILNLISFFQ